MDYEKKPKFKVGDTIRHKVHGDKYRYTIHGILNDAYVLDSDLVLTFNCEDSWELAESEDEKIKKDIIQCVKYSGDNFIPFYKSTVGDMISYLKKQGAQKPLDDVAKEVTKNKETAMSFLKSCGIMNANGELADEYKIEQDEQKPSQRIIAGAAKEIVFEQKPAWSEEDENRINRLIAYFEDKESFTAEDDIVYANWLKSLRPQKSWKPSDEQMEALKKASGLFSDTEVGNYRHEVLTELYEQLKAL